jgi:hypothetical protein
MHKIHKVNNLEELKVCLNYFKENNYAYISYVLGEYGFINSFYKTIIYDFYLKMKDKGIKTVAFVFKDMKSFVYDCCDEIIEYQDIDFNDSFSVTNGVPPYYNLSRSKSYEFILKENNFLNLFFTLCTDSNGNYYNNSITFDETYKSNRYDENICLYKINNINIIIEPLDKISFF